MAATLNFDSSKDPVAEARLLVAVLGMWLREVEQEPVRPGRANFSRDDNGNLKSITVILEQN